MMVRALVPFSSHAFAPEVGQTAEIDDDLAADWVRAGYVEQVIDEPPAEPPATTAPPAVKTTSPAAAATKPAAVKASSAPKAAKPGAPKAAEGDAAGA